MTDTDVETSADRFEVLSDDDTDVFPDPDDLDYSTDPDMPGLISESDISRDFTWDSDASDADTVVHF